MASENMMQWPWILHSNKSGTYHADHLFETPDLNSSSSWANATNGTNDGIVPLSYKAIGISLGLVVFFFGFIGNVFVILVVTRTKSMHSPTNCYLVSLAAADCIVLLTATLPFTVGLFYEYGMLPYDTAVCAILTFFSYMGINVSSLSMTAFTVERYIAICHPMRAYSLCTISRAKKIILGLWIFSTCYSAPWLALTKVSQRHNGKEIYTTCGYKLERDQYFTYYLVDLVLFYLVPLCLIAMLYFLIGRVLVRSQKKQPKMTGMNNSVRQTVTSEIELETTTENVELRPRRKRKPTSRVQVIKMLVVVVVLFALLWLPYRVLVVYNSVSPYRFSSIWFLLLCRTFISVNSAINPLIYNLMSTKFRKAFHNTCISIINQPPFTKTETT